MLKPPRSAVIIIRNDKLLVIRRDKSTEPTYYVLPGGGIDEGETPEEAATREIQEELATHIKVVSVEIDADAKERQTYLVRADLVGDSELVWQEDHKQTPDNHYSVEWLPLSKLRDTTIFPEGTVKAVLES